LLASSLETAELTPQGFRDVGHGPGSREGEYIDWMTIKDQRQAVIDDVERIRNHPLVPESIPVHGFIYDVHSGKLIEVDVSEKAA
jgi:carbonic anhydrase